MTEIIRLGNPKLIGETARGFLLLLCTVTLLSSCTNLNGTTTSRDRDIIGELQKEVPFAIVVPTYLPADIAPFPTGYSGPGKGPTSENSTSFSLYYYRKNGIGNSVTIYQENHNKIFLPSRSSSVYLDIKGVKVLEEETELAVPSGASDVRILQGLFYAWSRGGMSLEVTIFGYGRDEGRKVVESMIK